MIYNNENGHLVQNYKVNKKDRTKYNYHSDRKEVHYVSPPYVPPLPIGPNPSVPLFVSLVTCSSHYLPSHTP